MRVRLSPAGLAANAALAGREGVVVAAGNGVVEVEWERDGPSTWLKAEFVEEVDGNYIVDSLR